MPSKAPTPTSSLIGRPVSIRFTRSVKEADTMPLRTQKLFSASTHLPHFSGRLIMSHNQRCRKTVNKLSPLREIKNFVEFVILPGAWDRLQNLTRSFDRRQGVSEERYPLRSLTERTTQPALKITVKNVVSDLLTSPWN